MDSYKQFEVGVRSMCSVFGILDIKSDATALRETALEMSKKMRHRGPDWSGIYSSEKAILSARALGYR